MTGRQILGITLVLLALMGASAARAADPEKRSIQYRDRERTYWLLVPETAVGSGPRPLLVLLHGSGRDGMSLMERWQQLAAREGVVVAAPESLDPRVWIAPADGPDLLRDIVERVRAEVSIDPRRVYLFGHSGGASFSLQMAVAESTYFAAAAVHAGRLHPESYPMADEARRKIPIKIVVGTNDRFFPVEAVQATHDALEERGFPIDLSVIPGHTHDYYGRAPSINEQCWEFLNSVALEGEPEFVQYRFE